MADAVAAWDDRVLVSDASSVDKQVRTPAVIPWFGIASRDLKHNV
jgi:hypothetical protein